MAKTRVLVVEDEHDIRELLVHNLSQSGFSVTAVTSGEEALTYAKSGEHDLILLDVMLPGIDGFEVCRRLKYDNRSNSIPVIMVTARSDDADVVAGLELGADGYILKPFRPSVLLARIRAVLRRKQEQMDNAVSSLAIHDLTIDSRRLMVSFRGEPIVLSTTEFRLLHLLATKPGWVFTRDQIVSALHDGDYHVTNRSIDVHVVGLRRKLGEASSYIETVRGAGYRFKE